MRIFKSEVKEMNKDGESAEQPAPTQAQPTQPQQIDAPQPVQQPDFQQHYQAQPDYRKNYEDPERNA